MLAGHLTAVNMTMLIERGGFLAALLGLLHEAAAGQGRLVFLGGEAGVGKTTLTAALAGGAMTAGGAGVPLAVRRGNCDNVTTAEALGPVVDALPELAEVLEAESGVSRLRLLRRIRATLTGPPSGGRTSGSATIWPRHWYLVRCGT